MGKNEEKITAYRFAKKVKRHPTEIMREVEKGNIKGTRETVEKSEYRIPVSELLKYGVS